MLQKYYIFFQEEFKLLSFENQVLKKPFLVTFQGQNLLVFGVTYLNVTNDCFCQLNSSRRETIPTRFEQAFIIQYQGSSLMLPNFKCPSCYWKNLSRVFQCNWKSFAVTNKESFSCKECRFCFVFLNNYFFFCINMYVSMHNGQNQ